MLYKCEPQAHMIFPGDSHLLLLKGYRLFYAIFVPVFVP